MALPARPKRPRTRRNPSNYTVNPENLAKAVKDAAKRKKVATTVSKKMSTAKTIAQMRRQTSGAGAANDYSPRSKTKPNIKIGMPTGTKIPDFPPATRPRKPSIPMPKPPIIPDFPRSTRPTPPTRRPQVATGNRSGRTKS